MPNPTDREQALFLTADRQGGYFTAKQARAAGYSYRVQNYHREQGHWLPIDRGIFRLRNFPTTTDHEDLIRWSLWSANRKGEPQIVFSHETALSRHNIGDYNPSKYHITVPLEFRKRVPGACILYRADVPAKDFIQKDGYRMTTPVRSLVDVIEAELDPDHILRAIRDALQKGEVQRQELESRLVSPKARKFLERYATTQLKQVGWRLAAAH